MVTVVPVSRPADPSGVVLVLHGGASRGERAPASVRQLSVLRMVPTAHAVARAGRHRLAVYRLINTWRGWDTERNPVEDAAEAIAELRGTHPDLPIGLVGHSLGGRAALLAGDQDGVDSVVALNPWVYPTDDNDLSGRRVLIVHGLLDRIAGPDRSEMVARRLGRRADVGYVRIRDGKHAMLRHGRAFDAYAAQFTAAVLLGDTASAVTGPVAKVLGGQAWVTA